MNKNYTANNANNAITHWLDCKRDCNYDGSCNGNTLKKCSVCNKITDWLYCKNNCRGYYCDSCSSNEMNMCLLCKPQEDKCKNCKLCRFCDASKNIRKICELCKLDCDILVLQPKCVTNNCKIFSVTCNIIYENVCITCPQ